MTLDGCGDGTTVARCSGRCSGICRCFRLQSEFAGGVTPGRLIAPVGFDDFGRLLDVPLGDSEEREGGFGVGDFLGDLGVGQNTGAEGRGTRQEGRATRYAP